MVGCLSGGGRRGKGITGAAQNPLVLLGPQGGEVGNTRPDFRFLS